MKTKIAILLAIFAFCANLNSQEYYRYYRGEKLILSYVVNPTKKYISVASPDDTLALRNRLAEKGIFAPEFRVYRSVHNETYICGTIVEGKDSLPDLTDDKAILYEGPYFMKKINREQYPDASDICVGGLNEELWVKLKEPYSEYYPLLERFAEENNVAILGDDYWSYTVLFTSKSSKGNSMQIANALFEAGWCDVAEFGIFDLTYDTNGLPTNIEDPEVTPDVIIKKASSASRSIIIKANDVIDYVEVIDLRGSVLYKSYPKDLQINWQANQRGVYIVRIKLQSSNSILNKKIVI
jgi:hypothetical protein